MKTYLFSLFSLFVTICFSQVPGTIYQRVQGTLGQKVLDSNNDGFISVTSSGFTSNDYGLNSELKMIALPVFEVEPINDLNTGSGGGHTDIASAGTNQSCYILKKSVDGINYLVIRFRLGGASTASKGYSLLIDSDGVFGTALSSNNLGFDREIVYETGNNGRIAIYKHELNNAGQLLASYNVNEYAQRSVAYSTVGGNLDYFYDFFVPLSAVDANNLVRFTAATVTSAGSGVLGTISDYNGIDDVKFGNNSLLLQQLIINAFPSVTFDALDENFDSSNWIVKTAAPIVNSGILTTSNSISGTSTETNGTSIKVYKNGVQIGTTSVSSNAWSLSSVSGLSTGDLITSKATASGKSESNASPEIVVSQVQECFLASPEITNRSSNNILGTWSGAVTPNGSNVRIQLYTQTDENTITLFSHTNYFVQSNGTFSVPSGLNTNVFNETNFICKAILVSSGCNSNYSNVSIKSSGNTNAIGVITTTPSFVTTTINQLPTAQNIIVKNNASYPVFLILYVNGIEVSRTQTTIASQSNHTFTVAALMENDLVSARAQGSGTTPNYWLSAVSTTLTVQLQNPDQSIVPTINGTYIAGSNTTVSGYSLEPSGTDIMLYKGGVLFGSTTVNIYGNWQITGLTLSTNDVLTAKAKAVSKSISNASSSVTVKASAPSAPTLINDYTVGSTQISGSSGLGTIRVYLNGEEVGSTNATGSWSITVDSNALYRDVVITAKNEVDGILSSASNSKTVTGVGGFCITLSDGSAFPSTINSGQTLNVKITAIQGTTCPGSTFSGFTGTVNLSSNVLISPEVSGTFVNGVWTGAISFGGTGSVTLTALNSIDPVAKGTAITTIQNNALWVGGISTDFNTAGNWSGNYVPSSGANITFDDAVQRDLHLDSSRIIGDLNFNSTDHTYKFVVGSNTIEVRGSIVNASSNKAFTTNDNSKITIAGYGASGAIYFSSNATLDEFVLNRTNTGSIAIGNAIRILAKLHIIQGALTTNGNITLASSVDKTAVVPSVEGSISGNVTVENFIPARRAFRFISPSVTTTTSINANWQEGVINTSTTNNLNPNSGYGTHITGNGQNGLDATQTTNYSMYTYNNVSSSWSSVGNTLSNSLSAGAAYRMLIRGDRSINLNSNTPTATTTILRATGQLHVGDFTISSNNLNQTSNSYSFIGNPYQSKVNMKEVLKGSGFQNQVWYWNSRVGSRGAYVSVDFTGDNDLVISGVGNSRIVAPGAAFFIRKQGSTTSSIVFKEAHKLSTTSDASVFRQQAREASNFDKINIALYDRNSALSNTILDGLLLVFKSGLNSELDPTDMPKIPNLDEDLFVNYENSAISIDKRNYPDIAEIIQLGIAKYRYTAYKLVFDLTQYSNLTPYLFDDHLNSYVQLQPGTINTYNFDVNPQIVSSINQSRFKIVYQPSNLSSEDFWNDIAIYPNPTKIGNQLYIKGITDGEIIVYNMLGQKIPTQITTIENSMQVMPLGNIQKGVYFVTILAQGKQKQLKWIIE